MRDADRRQPAHDEGDRRAQDDDRNDFLEQLVQRGDLTRRGTLLAMRMFVLALAVVACSKADPKPDPSPSPPPGSAAVAVASPGLAIFIGDQQVATVATAELAKWPRLDTLVPIEDRRLGRWEDVVLAGATPTTIHAPSTSYPELVPAVFLGSDGSPSFGMFDPVELAKHGTPQVRNDGVREVRIKIAANNGHGNNEQGAGGGADPTADQALDQDAERRARDRRQDAARDPARDRARRRRPGLGAHDDLEGGRRHSVPDDGAQRRGGARAQPRQVGVRSGELRSRSSSSTARARCASGSTRSRATAGRRAAICAG